LPEVANLSKANPAGLGQRPLRFREEHRRADERAAKREAAEKMSPFDHIR
jgi:hypothetical protein